VKKILIILFSIIVLSPFAIIDKQDVIKNNDVQSQADCTQITEELETELQEIALLFDDINQLKDHLNNDILRSKDQVEQEVKKVKHLTCLNYEDDENRTEEKLKIYGTMLEYYQELFKNEEELIVEEINYEIPETFHMLSLTVVLNDQRKLDIEYYIGFDASFTKSRYDWMQEEEILEEISKPMNIVKHEIIDQLYLFFINPLQQAFEDGIPSYYEGKNDLEWEIKISDIKLGSSYFDLEFLLADGDVEPRKVLKNEKRFRKVDVFPTKFTKEPLERWEEVHLINSDIPYPETLIQEENWLGVADFFSNQFSKMLDIDMDIPEYIGSGNTYDRDVEDIANGVEK